MKMKSFVLRACLICSLLASLTGFAGVTPARAATLTVTDCSAPSGAPGRLLEVIAAAAAGDTVNFACSGTITLSATLVIDKNLTITGAGQAVTLSGGRAVRVVYVNFGVIVELRGLTIAKGDSSDGNYDGGGIYNNGGTLTVVNSTFSDNMAWDDGGGIYNNGGTLTVANSAFSGNTARGDGGGIYNNGGTLIVTNSAFSGNTAKLEYPGTSGGGGIYNSGTLTVANSAFSSNTAELELPDSVGRGGGGIYNSGALTVANSTFSGNTVRGSFASYSEGGGGIKNSNALTVVNSTFSGNTIDSNSLFGSGGGINNSGALTIANSTFSGNAAFGWSGGHIHGGGISNDAAGTLNFANTIIANSLAGGDCSSTGTLGTNTHNLVGDGTCSPALSGAPWLGPLADNGGPTSTFALLEGSPAIDAGDDAVCAAAPVSGLDQRGVARPYGAHCDIGAYELNLQVGPSFVVNNSSDADDGRCGLQPGGDCTLREALNAANAHAGADTISFAAALSGQIILLGSTLTLADDVTIDGAGVGITLSGQNTVRVLAVNSGVTAVLQGLTIANGSAGGSYGGGLTNAGTLTVTNSTFSGNTVSLAGGGIFNDTAGKLTVVNSAFSGNTASWAGGGIYNAGTLTVLNSTLSGNSASYGGGIYNYGTLSYANTILANSPAGGDCSGTGTLGTNTHNLVEDGSCGAALSGDPLLGALGSYGGSTHTFALLPGSPALDAGDDAICAAPPVSGLDQRGVARSFGAHCDIGAYELSQQVGPNFVVNDSSNADDGICEVAPGGDCTLREALGAANAHAGADTISFAAALSGQTILLGSTLTLASDVTIDGGGVDITLSGQNAVGVLAINSGVTAVLQGLTIANGSAVNAGGISNAGILTIKDSAISGCSASWAGGGIYNASGGELTVLNSTLSANTSGNFGGAIFNSGGLGVTNSTFSANSAPNGGGIYNENSLVVTNSSLSGNTGSGIYNTASMGLANTIIANSLAGPDCTNVGTLGTNTHNLVEDGTCSPALSGDPLLGALADNGGPTSTFALLEGSPAIDAGDDAACPATDQRGVARPFGAHCDIGAYELIAQFGPSFVVNDSRDADDGRCELKPGGDCTLREALNMANAYPGPNSISFAAALSGQTILLGSTLTLASDVTIDGGGVDITLSGQNAVGVLAVNSGVTAVLQGLTIANGSAINAGGISNAGILTIKDSAISGCSASWAGGGIYNASGGELTVLNSTLSGNTSGNMGGGIANFGGLGVSNSTFSANSAPNGGGIYNENSLVVTNSSLSGNTGSGIYNTASLSLANTIIANSPAGPDCTNAGTLGTNTHNLVEDGTCSPALSGDPLLGVLADNGGATSTFALLEGSPALDAGDDAVCAAAPVNGLDQRGVARSFGAHCDIGAYELSQQVGPNFVVNDSSNADDGICEVAPGGDCTLREALGAANAHAGADTISFAAALSGQTILLGSTLTLASDVTIDGGGVDITLSGQNAVGVLAVNSGVTAALQGLTIANGSAINAGGISNAGILTIKDSAISGCSASWAGGAIYNASGGELTVLNSTLSGNASGTFGGGIANFGGLVVSNSTFSANSAPNGGGIYNENSLLVTNSSLSGNTGSGIYNTASLSLANTIIANSPAGPDCTNAGTLGTNTHNLVEDGTCSPALSGDPLLGALGSYVGATQTFALLPGSPAIDAGDDAICAAAPVSGLDQRGVARPFGAHCDIGAFESQGFTLAISGGNNQSALLNTGFTHPLTVTVTALNIIEPVEGGRIAFTAPLSGASAIISGSPATISGGAASVTAAANDHMGPYTVTASATGSNPVNFNLENKGFYTYLPVVLRSNTSANAQTSRENEQTGQKITTIKKEKLNVHTLFYNIQDQAICFSCIHDQQLAGIANRLYQRDADAGGNADRHGLFSLQRSGRPAGGGNRRGGRGRYG